MHLGLNNTSIIEIWKRYFRHIWLTPGDFLVAKGEWESSGATQKGSWLFDYFGSLVTLEASKSLRFYGIALNLVNAVSQADEES
jgi:hypothetical protein